MDWIIVPAAYCLGSISFGLLLFGRIKGRDLREVGSGNPGATNVLRSAGRLPALAVLALDVAKGALPILIGLRLDLSAPLLCAAAVATVMGHMYPLFHGFRGGKGVATAAGALGALEPRFLLPCGVVFALVLITTRYVSLASMSAVALYPAMVLAGLAKWRLAFDTRSLATASGLIALLVIWRHRQNVSRLLAHDESRFGGSRRPS